MAKARMLTAGLAALALANSGCLKTFQRDGEPSMPAKEDSSTKPETMVALGNARLEAASAPERPSNQRDTLLAQALEAYRSALDHDPNHVPAMIGIASVYTGMHDREKALATYQQALRVAPKSAELWFELGRCQGRFKDWTAAAASMQQATVYAPDNLKYRKMLGLTLARAGRYEEGYAYLARSMSEAEARYVLGRMMVHNGQEATGREQMALAVAANPGFAPAKEFLEDLMGTIDENAVRPAARFAN